MNKVAFVFHLQLQTLCQSYTTYARELSKNKNNLREVIKNGR
ncbi:hypothetical protein GCM10028868_36710 [Virgibacillus kimchii]